MNGKSDLRLQSFISDILQRRKSLWLSFYSFMYDILSLNLSRDWVLFLPGKKKRGKYVREAYMGAALCSEGYLNAILVNPEG